MAGEQLLRIVVSFLAETLLPPLRLLTSLSKSSRVDLLESPTQQAVPDAHISEAKPTTPPKAAETRGSYRCIIDYNSTPFSINWSGSSAYPDLATFPSFKNPNIEVAEIFLGSELDMIWRRSKLHDYGSYASIRTTDDDSFPILKLAHPGDDFAIHLIKREINVLVDLKKLGIKTVEFDPQGVICDGVLVGYRMKELVKLEPGELSSRSQEIRDALKQLHSAGFCHGDFNPSNVMKGEDNGLVLIDFSFAGQIGSPVPPFIPAWQFPTGSFCVDADMVALERYLLPG